MELAQVLSQVGMTFAEWAVFFHVEDTVVVEREGLAGWTARHLPNGVPHDVGFEECLAAIDSLVRRGLLIELTADDIEQDLARWRAEPIPVSWGVSRDREVGNVDLTEAGFHVGKTIARLRNPSDVRRPADGYNDEEPSVIRVFGETEAACRRGVEGVIERIARIPWYWSPSEVKVEPVRPMGPWWFGRFERVPTGFEIIIRRIVGARAN